MKHFLYANNEQVGWSALEGADPAMGCVSGVFYPNENYERIKDVIYAYSKCCALGGQISKPEREEAWRKVEVLALSVKPENGAPFEPIGGVALIDHFMESEDETRYELHVLGLPRETFIEYFREAHDGYFHR